MPPNPVSTERGQSQKKLERNPQLPAYILTEPGIGYRLMAHATDTEEYDA
jgi:DNA-binding response OmpR family regulator